jgi:hypothetical protein
LKAWCRFCYTYGNRISTVFKFYLANFLIDFQILQLKCIDHVSPSRVIVLQIKTDFISRRSDSSSDLLP